MFCLTRRNSKTEVKKRLYNNVKVAINKSSYVNLYLNTKILEKIEITGSRFLDDKQFHILFSTLYGDFHEFGPTLYL